MCNLVYVLTPRVSHSESKSVGTSRDENLTKIPFVHPTHAWSLLRETQLSSRIYWELNNSTTIWRRTVGRWSDRSLKEKRVSKKNRRKPKFEGRVASEKRTSEREKGMAAIRTGMSKNSAEVPPITVKGEKPMTAQTPSSVEEDSEKAVTGRMPLIWEMSVSQGGGSESLTGQMSAARGSTESNWPEKGSPARGRSSLGREDRLSILQKEDVEEFGEFLHEGKSVAPPIVGSFEEDALLKRPPPDFVLGQKHWIGLHEEIGEKLWQIYRLVNPTTFAEVEQSKNKVEAISRAREELAEKKAREVFEDEHEKKSSGLQSRLEETTRRMWGHDDRVLRTTEERIAGAEALVKELKVEAAAASSNQRETYDQYHRHCREWRTEEARSEREFRATFHQDWLRQPLKLPDLPPSVFSLKEGSKLAEPQRSAAPQSTNAEAS